MHRLVMSFLNENMQLHIAKGLKVSTISSILNLNFKTEKKMIEQIPLDNITLAIKSWMEILQLLKTFAAQNDLAVKKRKRQRKKSLAKSFAQPFDLLPSKTTEKRKNEKQEHLQSQYFKMLKFGLSHFAKVTTFYDRPTTEKRAHSRTYLAQTNDKQSLGESIAKARF